MNTFPEGQDWYADPYVNPPTVEDVTFLEFSRESSSKHVAKLETLSRDIEPIYALPEQSSLLALSEQTHISGLTHPIDGLIGIDPKLLDHPEAAIFTGIHESVHARLADNSTGKAIDDMAPNFRSHFHSVLVPAWVKGEIELTENRDYIRYRGYDGLVPDGWSGPHAITLDSTKATLGNYFTLVARDMIESDPSGRLSHVDMFYRSWAAELDAHPVRTPEHFAESSRWLAELMITGFGMGDQLLEYSRNNVRDRDMLAWEEGLANRIASDFTGMSLEAIQAVAPQDEYKLQLAQRLGDAGLSGQQLAEEVHTYDDLYSLVKTHF